MTIEVEAPDGSTHEFPDGTDQAVIKKAMADYVKSTKSKYASSQDEQRDAKRWDIGGDIKKAFTGAKDALVKDASDAFPSAAERAAKTEENTKEYGPALGGLKDAVYDQGLKPMGKALSVPMDAMGMAASPVTGAINALGGSALSYLPGMDKTSADEALDKSLMLMGPEGMEAGLPGVAAASTARAGATSAKVAQQNALARQANPAFAEARDAGYVVHPADAVAEPGATANALSAVGGKVKTQQAASVKNQAVTNKIAAKELGLPDDAPLDEATFKQVRAKTGEAYEALKDTGKILPKGVITADTPFKRAISDLDERSESVRKNFPNTPNKPDIEALQNELGVEAFTPESAVEKIKQLRYNASRNLKAGYQSPALEDLGRSQRKAATALEDLMDRHLNAVAEDATITTKRTDPAALQSRNVGKNSVDTIRQRIQPGSNYSPVVTVRNGAQEVVLDGAKRVALAKERGEPVPTISINKGRYDKLKAAGFTDMEISYGALDSSGYTTAAKQLADQFPKSDIKSVGPSLSKEFSRGAQLDGSALKSAINDYRAARQTIAKAHDIESVTDERGNVDARKLATLGNRRPLTGGLKTIADTADAFPKSMQNPTKFGGAEKLSVLDMGSMLGSGMAALATGRPELALGALAPLARPAARSVALSNSIQNRLLGLRSTRPGIRQNAAPAIGGQNALRSLANGVPAGGQGGGLPGQPPMQQPAAVAPPQVPTPGP